MTCVAPSSRASSGGNLDAHRAVDQQTIAGADRLEQTGVGAARANRKKDVAGIAEGHRFAGAEVGRHDAERNPHLFEAVVLSRPWRNRFIRSLPMNPIRQRLQRATSLNRMQEPTRPMSSARAPLA